MYESQVVTNCLFLVLLSSAVCGDLRIKHGNTLVTCLASGYSFSYVFFSTVATISVSSSFGTKERIL